MQVLCPIHLLPYASHAIFLHAPGIGKIQTPQNTLGQATRQVDRSSSVADLNVNPMDISCEP